MSHGEHEGADQLNRNLECHVAEAVDEDDSEKIKISDTGLDVRTYFAVPKWLKTQFTFPYQFNSTFIGKYGMINYDLNGPIHGKLVLCFHGLNGTRATYQDLQNGLASFQCRLLTFDLYGHGLSATPTFQVYNKNYGLNFFVDQAFEVLDHLKLREQRLSVFGFSMGCIIACAFAVRHRDYVDRMVLMSPAGMIPKRPGAVHCLQVCQCYIPCSNWCVCRCCVNRKEFDKKFSRHEIENGIADQLWNRVVFQLFVKGRTLDPFAGCVLRMPLWSAETWFDQTGDLNIPTLLLWGANDQVVPVSCAPEVQAKFKNSHLIVFWESTHLVISDRFQHVLAVLISFMEFPPGCSVGNFRYLLPISPRGEYVPRKQRCPTDSTIHDYWRSIQFSPKYEVYVKHKRVEGRGDSGEDAAISNRKVPNQCSAVRRPSIDAIERAVMEQESEKVQSIQSRQTRHEVLQVAVRTGVHNQNIREPK